MPFIGQQIESKLFFRYGNFDRWFNLSLNKNKCSFGLSYKSNKRSELFTKHIILEQSFFTEGILSLTDYYTLVWYSLFWQSSMQFFDWLFFDFNPIGFTHSFFLYDSDDDFFGNSIIPLYLKTGFTHTFKSGWGFRASLNVNFNMFDDDNYEFPPLFDYHFMVWKLW